MASPGRIPSSPPKGSSIEEELAHYKAQYEQVELELQEFQNSSKELEAELERDIEESEKRERELREKAEALSFEVDEWKSKYTQSKAEANTAHNNLQKEITTLRETNRTLQLKLRDVEVQNDDFERQTRHQTSSLEDLESKYNISVERGVILEEDIKIGEQERETLRIDNQHLREELSDIKVELEIVQGKLRRAEATIERDRSRKPTPIATDARPRSPLSEGSGVTAETGETGTATTTSSPFVVTPPPTKSEASTHETSPPSPPESNAPAKKIIAPITPVPSKVRAGLPTTAPRLSGMRPPASMKHSRGPSIQTPGPQRIPTTTPKPGGIPRRSLAGTERSVSGNAPNTAPSSRSLHQIRGLIGKMQKLEERVHTARSKLPGPTITTAKASPRSSPRNDDLPLTLPPTVTVRSARKRASGSTATSSVAGDAPRSTASRLSFGFNPAGPKLSASQTDTPSRPSSRTSNAGRSSFVRPSSRASITSSSNPTGRTTPLFGESHRPRSSISGSYAAMHGIAEGARCVTPGPKPIQSNYGAQNNVFSRSVSAATTTRHDDGDLDLTPTAASHSVSMVGRKSGIPTPGMTGIPTPSSRRQSAGRRQSGTDRPPSSRGGGASALTGIGETF